MHESVIALGIIRTLERSLRLIEKQKKVVILLGELQNVDEDILDNYMRLYLEEEKISGITYEFRREAARFRCSVCGTTWTLSDVHLNEVERESVHFIPESIYTIVRCPSCGSNVYEIVSGRGVKVLIEEE